MNWFYAAQGQEQGPISQANLDEMFRNGAISADTLVWQEGMAGWEPYQTARGGSALSPIIGSAESSSGEESRSESVCNECGRALPEDETIAYGNVRVCAACKPAFLQKLKEGVALPVGDLNYAPDGARVGAYILDGIIFFGFYMIVTFLMGVFVGVFVGIGGSPTVVPLLPMLMLCIVGPAAIFYGTFMIGKYGGTLGKLAMKIKVVNADGSPVSYGCAFGRYFARLLSGMICLIGFIMAFFDAEKRALHDRICNTRVVIR